MSTATANPSVRPVPGGRSAAYIVQWLRELEECRVGGLITDEEYAVERAEKLSELLCQHRYLWLSPILASGTLASIAASVVWIGTMELQTTGLAAALAGLFGLVMLARPFRENLKNRQIRERLEILNMLLSYDLVSSDEFIIYEDRLLGGQTGYTG